MSRFKVFRLLLNTVRCINEQMQQSIPSYRRQFVTSRTLHDLSVPQNQATKGSLLEEPPDIPHCPSSSNKFTYRTSSCGELRLEHVGKKVTLCGWLEYQRMNKFVVLRDGYGRTQLLINDEDTEAQQLLSSSPYESIIKITGTVLERPKDMINKRQSTGEIEVAVESFEVINKANEKLPFNIREFQKAKESLRMQYRYLDLRFPEMQRNIRVRSQTVMAMRNYLVNECNFVDVETPTLFKSTPGGAQEFIVPTRFPGQFYSLAQSPQQFKQMLMAGGIDRYFQIARCYRDEGSRSDRQPEFTQLDIEMSFTNMSDVMELVEELLRYSWPCSISSLPAPFTKITYKKALEEYGSDKPDTRYGFKLQNCTDILNDKNLVNSNFGSFCLVFPTPHCILSKSMKDNFVKLAEKYSDIRFIQSKIDDVAEWAKKLGRLLGQNTVGTLRDVLKLQNNSVMFLCYGNKDNVLPFLGKIRLDYINILEAQGHKLKTNEMHPVWITDFPLFEKDSSTDQLKSAHHPFTRPHPDDLHLLETSPLQVRALAYDLVLNGNEVGGGSIRIHDPVQQELIFKMLNIDKSSMQHMLDMLASGCPPHGGIALGLDRLLSVILNTPSIRDVIAFPKTFEGRDLITGAPAPISEHDKKLYHIEIVPKNG